MASKHFENKARRSYWAVHIEAWRRSGVTRTQYCRQQRLTKSTFERWLDAISDEKSLRHKDKRRSKTPRSRSGNEARAKAVQAFWAMRVEALNWSGGNAAGYAKVHRLDPTDLPLWRRRLDAEPLAFDWRARLYPSALPSTSQLLKISTGVSSAAKEPAVETPLTEGPAAVPASDRRANRRRFSDAEKLAIVQEADTPGVTAAAICRRHGIVTSMLFRWRVQFGFGQNERAKLAAVQVGDQHTSRKRMASAAPFLLHDLLRFPTAWRRLN